MPRCRHCYGGTVMAAPESGRSFGFLSICPVCLGDACAPGPQLPRVRGFFASLSEGQKYAALAYRGPENHGDPDFRISRGALSANKAFQ